MGLEDLRKKQNDRCRIDDAEYQEFLRFKEMKKQYTANEMPTEPEVIYEDENVSSVHPSDINELFVEFSQVTLMPWIKGSIRIVRDQRLIQTRLRNTLFGIIPAGENAQSIRMTNISAVRLNQRFNGGAFFLGIVMVIGALLTILSSGLTFWNFILFWLGVAAFLSGISTCLVIQRVSDPQNVFYIYVPFYEKEKMLIAKDFIEDTLTRTEERSDIERAANIIVNGLGRK